MNPIFNRIMIACDLSNMDIKLMNCAGNLARNANVQKIFLVHVISDESTKFAQNSTQKSEGIYPIDEKVRFDLAENARKQIGAWSIDIETIVVKGNIYNELRGFTDNNDIDLVILGRKNSKAGNGSMAKRLARNVDASVLFLTQTKSQYLDSVLVPVDFSKYSAKALQTAIQYKKNMKLPIRIKGLHILEVAQPMAGFSIMENKAIELEQLSKTEAFYQDFLDENNIDQDEVEKVIVTDSGKNVSATIYSDIMKDESKLVILGAKGQTAIEKYFYGSVTERLVEDTADIPVLVVR